MWKNNTLYFGSNLTADAFARMDEKKKLKEFLKRVEESFLVPAEIIDQKKDEALGFASILLSCSAVEALAKIYFPNEASSSKRFNKFCLENIGIRRNIFEKMCIYDAYRCGIAHEGRIKRRFAVSYQIDNAFWENGVDHILNPLVFRRTFLQDIQKHFRGSEMHFGEIVKNLFED